METDYLLQITTSEDGSEGETGSFACSRTVTGNTVQLDVLSDGGVKMVFGISPDFVTLSRVGENSYSMEFTPGKIQSFNIIAPFGQIPVLLETRDMALDLNVEDGGLRLDIEYSLRFSDDTTKEFKINLKLIRSQADSLEENKT